MIVAMVADLMDRSRIQAVVPEVVVIRAPTDLARHPGATLVIVDLDRIAAEALAEVVSMAVPVVGFGSHVDGDRLRAASALGVDAMARSRFFGHYLSSLVG